MTDFHAVNNEAEGRFEVRVGDDIAFTEYRPTGRGIMFPHTLVPPAFEGQGVGGALAKAALDWVRTKGEQVLPTCTFIAGWIRRHPEYHDLVHPLYRGALHLDDAELEEGLQESFPASDPPSAVRRED